MFSYVTVTVWQVRKQRLGELWPEGTHCLASRPRYPQTTRPRPGHYGLGAGLCPPLPFTRPGPPPPRREGCPELSAGPDMPRRHRNPWTQQVAPKGLPGDGARRRNDPLLPKLPLPQPRVVSSAGAPTGSRASGGDDGWWQSSGGGSPRPELGVGVRSAPRRLPTLPIVAPRAAQDPTKLSSLLLPPVLPAGAPRAPAPRRPRPEGGEDPCSGSAREAPHPLLALLGELVPSKFRVFLQRLGAECALATQPSEAPPKDPQGAGRGGVISGMNEATDS